MNREDIIRMAREAGATPYTNRHYPDRPTHTFNPEQLERFAALVAAAAKAEEREACAKVCDIHARGWEMHPGQNPQAGFIATSNCAAAIRARGEIK